MKNNGGLMRDQSNLPLTLTILTDRIKGGIHILYRCQMMSANRRRYANRTIRPNPSEIRNAATPNAFEMI